MFGVCLFDAQKRGVWKQEDAERGIKMARNTTDLTSGRPLTGILRFSVPLVCGNLLQQLYALTDSLIVSRCIGIPALAAVGGTGFVRWGMLNLCLDCALGFGVVASQRKGARDTAGFKKVTVLSLRFAAVVSLLLTVLFWTLTEPLLTMMEVRPEIRGMAGTYFRFACAGIPASLFYNVFSALLRANGDSRGPFAAVAASTMLNVVLDVLFVAVLKWGMAGAGAATLLSQILAAFLTGSMVCGREPFRAEESSRKWDGELFRKTAVLWGPLLFNSLVLAAGGILIERGVNARGAAIAAGFSAGTKIYCFFEGVEKGVGSALGVYVGQNRGAGEADRIRRGMQAAGVLAVLLSVGTAAVLLLAGDRMLWSFMGEGELSRYVGEAMQAGKQYLLVQAAAVFAMIPMHFYRNAVSGLGYGAYPLMGSAAQLAARALTALVLAKTWGLTAFCASDGLASVAALPFVVFPFYHHLALLRRSLENAAEQEKRNRAAVYGSAEQKSKENKEWK